MSGYPGQYGQNNQPYPGQYGQPQVYNDYGYQQQHGQNPPYPGQYGQNTQYGQNNQPYPGQYGQNTQYGQNPPYPGQYGQNTQFGQNTQYGQQFQQQNTQYGQNQYGQNNQPYPGQYGQTTQDSYKVSQLKPLFQQLLNEAISQRRKLATVYKDNSTRTYKLQSSPLLDVMVEILFAIADKDNDNLLNEAEFTNLGALVGGQPFSSTIYYEKLGQLKEGLGIPLNGYKQLLLSEAHSLDPVSNKKEWDFIGLVVPLELYPEPPSIQQLIDDALQEGGKLLGRIDRAPTILLVRLCVEVVKKYDRNGDFVFDINELNTLLRDVGQGPLTEQQFLALSGNEPKISIVSIFQKDTKSTVQEQQVFWQKMGFNLPPSLFQPPLTTQEEQEIQQRFVNNKMLEIQNRAQMNQMLYRMNQRIINSINNNQKDYYSGNSYIGTW